LMQRRGRKSVWKIWLVSYVVWIFLAFMAGFSMYRFNVLFWKPSGSLWDQVRVPLINYLIFATFTPVLLQISLRYPIERSNWRGRSILYGVGAIVFAIGHVFVRMLVYPVIDSMTKQPFPLGWSLFGRLFLYNFLDDCVAVYLPVVAIAHVLWYYHEFRDRDLRTSQLETRLAQAQLKALKSQLQPHFLFNTLHSISTLMLTNVQAADTMLVRLSDLLRMSLENNTAQETTLNREMQFVNGYLEIEKMRFGDRLQLRCDVHPDTLDARVPHLLLQPLVENAIRHGASRRAEGGEVWITAMRRNDDLHIEVGDNGPGFSRKPEWNAKHGLGLNATRERLRVFYGDRQRLDIHSAPGRGTTVSVQLPFSVGEGPVVYELEAIHGLR
jgi:two-component system, LytTR family, sensor kinase